MVLGNSRGRTWLSNKNGMCFKCFITLCFSAFKTSPSEKMFSTLTEKYFFQGAIGTILFMVL